MSVKCDLDEGETQNSVLVVCETWHVWRWDTNVVTQAEVELYMDEGEIGIFGPGWKWAGTWMEMKQEFWDLEAGEAGNGRMWRTHPETRMSLIWAWIELICIFSGLGWRRESTLKELMQESWDLDADETRPGYRWDTHLEIRMGLRLDMDGIEMQF